MNTLPLLDDAARVLAAATDNAAQQGCPPTSLHLLCALVEAPGPSRDILLGASTPQGRSALTQSARTACAGIEPGLVFVRLRERASAVAQNARAEGVEALHLLLALLRLREARAFALLEELDMPLSALRNAAVTAMAQATANRTETAVPSAACASAALPGRGAPTGPAPRSPQGHKTRGSGHSPIARASAGENTTVSVAAPGPAGPFEPRTTSPAKRDGAAAPQAPVPPRSAPPRARTQAPRKSKKPPRTRSAPRKRPSPAALFALRPLHEVAPVLAEVAVDLSARARAGELDAAIGRDHEMDAVIDVLGKRRANNPVLVGPAGVGKTAIVEGIALAWANAASPHPNSASRRLVALDTTALVAGTGLRGSLSERIGAIKQEVLQAKGQLIVFIDEIHQLIGAGASGDGPQDAAGELKTALARGEFPCIGATTHDEFKRYIERDPPLERRFSPVFVQEPDCALAERIVSQSLAPYELHHGVVFCAEAVHAAVDLTHRFVTERKLPDKAFAALDLAGSRARRRGQDCVHVADVAQVVHELCGVPLARLNESDKSRFARAEQELGEHIVGHAHAVQALARALRRGFAGFNGKRPMGSFLFLGPTGVGKTQMAKALATFVFGDESALVRIDMSELGEKHAVARLLGAQPGYVGYEEGGQLTEALRKRPFQIVLFDEVEKAHPDVLNILLQLLDEGHLTDAQGRKVSFTHTLILLTSNLGANSLQAAGGIGFGSQSTQAASTRARQSEAVLTTAQSALPPELWGRLDEQLVFLPLLPEELLQVARRQLQAQRKLLWQQRKVALRWDAGLEAYLVAQAAAFGGALGARSLRKVVSRLVEAPIAEGLLDGSLVPPCGLHVSAVEPPNSATPGAAPLRFSPYDPERGDDGDDSEAVVGPAATRPALRRPPGAGADAATMHASAIGTVQNESFGDADSQSGPNRGIRA